MIPYVGDLSSRDADLLRLLASRSDRILEFGVGASTQIFAAYGCGKVESVDTSAEWIAKTAANLNTLEARGFDLRPVTFRGYAAFRPVAKYDLIFVDGLNELRLPFALLTWPALIDGGFMCLHDTRRTAPYGNAKTSDVQHVCAIIERHSAEIDTIALNQNESNTTVIAKRSPLLLEDYNAIEGRTRQQLGLE